jgi:hypothetical protein
VCALTGAAAMAAYAADWRELLDNIPNVSDNEFNQSVRSALSAIIRSTEASAVSY